jgi:hypothetical protein
MRTFKCGCGAQVYFENTRCLACARDIGFMPSTMAMGFVDTPGLAQVRQLRAPAGLQLAGGG